MVTGPFLGLALIRQQNGSAKAKPLTMHNKTLIRESCLKATYAA
jgi:hypothetical protein